MNKYIIMLMGPNGFGKGTQASRMVKAYDLVHISVGDIFRWNIQYHTKLAATRGQASARSVRHAHNGRSRQIRDKRDCMVTVQTDFSSRRSRMLLTLLRNGLRSVSGDAFMAIDIRLRLQHRGKSRESCKSLLSFLSAGYERAVSLTQQERKGNF